MVITGWKTSTHKVLTYVEYRAVSSVFRNIDPPPLPLASVSPPTKGGGYTDTLAGVRGWGVNILEDARHWIGLLKYNFSTLLPVIYCTSAIFRDIHCTYSRGNMKKKKRRSNIYSINDSFLSPTPTTITQ